LFSGYAKDGGLYLPETIPEISLEEKSSWAQLSYPQLAVEILSKFIGSQEIPKKDLEVVVKKSVARFLSKDEG
jgi:threonine synthase